MKVLIYNKDLYFLKAFSDFLPQKFPDVSLDTFSVREKAINCMESGEEFEIIIGPEDFLKCAPKNALHIISGSRTFIPEETDGSIYLNIYQRKDAIASDLKRIIAHKSGAAMSMFWGDSDTKIISVLSPQGGSGKTTAAYLLAAAAVKCGLKPVFVSLEPFATLDKLCSDYKKTGFGDIAFRLEDERDLRPVILEKIYKNEHEINMLPVPDNLEDLLSISKDEFSHLMDALAQLPDVDIVVLDVGFPPSEAVVEILKKSHVIVLTANDSGMGAKKLESLRKDPFISLGSMGAEVLTLWNKCRSEGNRADNEIEFPYSESIAKGVPAGKVLSGNNTILQGCCSILNIAKAVK